MNNLPFSSFLSVENLMEINIIHDSPKSHAIPKSCISSTSNDKKKRMFLDRCDSLSRIECSPNTIIQPKHQCKPSKLNRRDFFDKTYSVSCIDSMKDLNKHNFKSKSNDNIISLDINNSICTSTRLLNDEKHINASKELNTVQPRTTNHRPILIKQTSLSSIQKNAIIKPLKNTITSIPNNNRRSNMLKQLSLIAMNGSLYNLESVQENCNSNSNVNVVEEKLNSCNLNTTKNAKFIKDEFINRTHSLDSYSDRIRNVPSKYNTKNNNNYNGSAFLLSSPSSSSNQNQKQHGRQLSFVKQDSVLLLRSKKF